MKRTNRHKSYGLAGAAALTMGLLAAGSGAGPALADSTLLADTPSATATATGSATATPTSAATSTATATATNTPVGSATATATATSTPGSTSTATPTPIGTRTPGRDDDRGRGRDDDRGRGRDDDRGRPAARPVTHLGTVTSVGSNQFTVKDRNGRVATVMVDSTTRYQQPGKRDPGFSDIKTGMNIGVYGVRQAPAKGETGAAFTIKAMRVQLPRVKERFAHLMGSITALSDSSVTLLSREGKSVTATITAETKKLPPSATFAVGDRALLFVRYVDGADTGTVLQMVKLGTTPPAGTATATPTATATGSTTATPTSTATGSATATPTSTATGSATATATSTATGSATATATSTATGSATATPTATATGSTTPTATASVTATATGTPVS